ncbi:MAG: carboxypeptidase-like regulatory domain-containing protein [Pyrinomonadaceae bacterium]
MNDIEGTAVDSGGNLLADVCLALFTEKTHRFVAQTMTDEDGHFKFGKIPKGKYRLVGNFYPFCTANAQIRRVKKKSSESSESPLVLHLQVQGTDSCSYFDTK